MPARLRKLIGLLAILAFLVAYVVAAIWVGERLPSHWAVQIAYFAVAGTAWWLPLMPLFRWMNAGR